MLPGEFSLAEKIFTNELLKVKGPKKPGEQLRQRVKNSEINIKHILTGKGLLETFKAENTEVGGDQHENNDIAEGLPVFNNISYANDLS